MGKIKRKGTSGQAKNFITRTQAVRKLQISLPDFRRLCIFKAKKIARSLGRGEVGDAARLEKKGASKLSLDHIVKERYPVRRGASSYLLFTKQFVIQAFVDALRDLDDALSLLSLFANLPSTSTVPPKTIALCQRLCLEFQRYLIATNSLRKSFLSIKGIYYQATVQGQDILWLVPYKFVQRVTGDVDYRIMGTFVEFYTTLLGFVNYRLYTSIGLVYPPRFNAKSDEQGGELSALVLEGKSIEEPGQINAQTNGDSNGQSENDKSSEHAHDDIQKQIAAIEEMPDVSADAEGPQEYNQEDVVNNAIDTFEATGDDADILPQPQASSDEAASLFTSSTFFISRETPRPDIEFIVRAFGCKRFSENEADPTITHQVVDRPPLAALPEVSASLLDRDAPDTNTVRPGHRVPGRIYVQPQWVWDCINEVKLLRPDRYAPGATLPPHLSPWVKPIKGVYDPTAPLAEQEREGEAIEAEELGEDVETNEKESEAESEDGSSTPVSKSHPIDGETVDVNDMDVAETDSDSGSDSAESATSATSSFAGFDDVADSEPEDEATMHQRELEAEAAGLTFSEATRANGTPLKGILKHKTGAAAKSKAAKKAEEEELERRKMMMGRKKRKLVDKMLFSNSKKDTEAEKLRAKRRKIEGSKRQPVI
ncbi:pescadillo, partial [Lecanoromycetidae sp. Uapishka_2]